MGNGEILHPGEFQRMSAGTGITHSEFNPSKTEPVHLYQIWLFPKEKGLTPSYEQKRFDVAEKPNEFHVVASPDAENGSLTIHQDARILLAVVDQDQALDHTLRAGRSAWLQILRGTVTVNGHTLSAGDGAAYSDESTVSLIANTASEVMLFDLA